MRKIRIFEHISLDGVIEHDEGYAYGAWTAPYRSPAGLAAVIEVGSQRSNVSVLSWRGDQKIAAE